MTDFHLIKKRMRIGLARVSREHNTALYFERALRAQGHEVVVLHEMTPAFDAQALDLFLAVDRWFGGIPFVKDFSCPTAVVLIDVHRDLPTRSIYARFFDHVFVAQRDSVDEFKRQGHTSAHWLPLGGDFGVHFVPDLIRDIDVGFVGKMGTPGTDRHAVLSSVLDRFSTNETERFHTPQEMGEVYSRSKIVLNKSISGDVNMRVFEALAAGALLVTDRIENGFDELMTEGEHYVAYETAEEAVAQIDRYLSNDEARTRIAKAGQDLLRARHSYDARLAQILNVVQVAGAARPAPARHASPAQPRLWRAEWARRRGVSPGAAVALLAEGLPPEGYADLTVGLARGISHTVRAAFRQRS